MKNLLRITCYLLLLAATAAAQIPLRWETDVARPAPAQFTRYDGDAITFEPAWLAYGAPLATNGMTFTLYWQTNGMGAVWFTNTAGNAFQWLPEYYTGAPQYTFFIGADGHNYQANGVLRVLPSPGRKPNTLTPPIPYLDFLATPCINAPWLLPDALGGYATEAWAEGLFAKKGDIPEIPDLTEADPVALPYAVNASNLAAKAIALALTNDPARLLSPDRAETYTAQGGVVTKTTGQGVDRWMYQPPAFIWPYTAAPVVINGLPPLGEWTWETVAEGAAESGGWRIEAAPRFMWPGQLEIRAYQDGSLLSIGYYAPLGEAFGQIKLTGLYDGVLEYLMGERTTDYPLLTQAQQDAASNRLTGVENGLDELALFAEDTAVWAQWAMAEALGKVSSATVAAIWTGTQGEYDAIAVPDPQTLYIILEDGP